MLSVFSSPLRHSQCIWSCLSVPGCGTEEKSIWTPLGSSVWRQREVATEPVERDEDLEDDHVSLPGGSATVQKLEASLEAGPLRIFYTY